MDIGKTLYKYRLSLGLTLEEMSSNIITTSYYSKIEKGQHRISAEDLLSILSKHSININSFFKEANYFNKNTNEFDDLKLQIMKNYLNNNFNELGSLKEIISTHKLLSNESKIFLLTMIELCQSIINGNINNVSAKNKNFIKEKIFNLNNWDEFKLMLYSNSIPLYDIESNNSIINSIINKNYETYTHEQIILIFTIILNFIGICIEKNEDELAIYYLKKIEKIEPSFDTTFHRLLKTYYYNLINYRITPKSIYEQNINNIIKTMQLADLELFHNNLKKYFEKNKKRK